MERPVATVKDAVLLRLVKTLRTIQKVQTGGNICRKDYIPRHSLSENHVQVRDYAERLMYAIPVKRRI